MPLVVAPGQPASAIPGRLASSTTIDVGGETIGVVGATTPELASIASTGRITVRPEDGDDLEALAAEIQPSVDALVADGIVKIVLLSHMQQIGIEQALATRLEGVDIIVAGGSNTILADADDALRPGNAAVDDYPLEYESASGEPVLLVNIGADYRYLGRLVVVFDAAGTLLPESLVPSMRVRSAELVDEGGETVDVLVEDGQIVGDSARPIRVVILDFIAKCVGAEEECGDGYPLQGLANPDRVDLVDAGIDPGLAGFSDPGSEQDALAEYLATFFADSPFDEAETPAAEDERIRNLGVQASGSNAP